MKTLTLKIFVLILFLGTFSFSYGQDPVYTSFYENPLYYNPASPGIIYGSRFYLNFREQWPGIPADNRAFNFSSMHSFCNSFSLGIMASSNIEGESRLLTNTIGFTIAVPVKITRYIAISTGITSSYGQKRIDWSAVEFDDQFDKLYGKIYNTSFPFPNDNRKNYGDLSVGMALKGLFYKNNNISLSGVFGIGLNHAIVFPNPNFIGTDINAIPFKQVYQIDLWLKRKQKKDGFSIASIYEKQAQIETFNLSFRYLINTIYVLTGFRNKKYYFSFHNYDSFILGFGYFHFPRMSNNNIKFGYTYDFTVSKLAGGALGSHEIYIVYSINRCVRLNGKRKYKYNPSKECLENEFNPNGLFLKR